MLLGFHWAREAFGDRAALYTALFTLTSAGVFLFTRVFIPDPLLSLLLAASLYCFLKSLDPRPARHLGAPNMLDSEMWDSTPPCGRTKPAPASPDPGAGTSSLSPYALWTLLALAVLTKGLVALVFVFGAAILYLALTGDYRHWRRLRPLSGLALLIAIAAPWHVLDK